MLLRRILLLLDPEQVILFKLNRFKNSDSLGFASELDENKIGFISQNTKIGGSILEFGAGGSTLEMLRRGFRVTSIESDRFFAKKLNKVAMVNFGVSPVKYINIGVTGIYGFPASRLNLYNRLRGRFRNYVNQVLKGSYDTIIIDGRFRVATFMKAAILLEKKPTLIVIDDYKFRNEYHVLEEILKFEGEIGEMAYYYSKSIPDLKSAHRLLDMYVRDPR